MISSSTITLDSIPGEEHLIFCLQKHLTFQAEDRVIKKGKLLLFRRYHYFLQLTLMTEKNTREHFDIPIPLGVEFYPDDKLLYFDYRPQKLLQNVQSRINAAKASQHFNKIVEITIS